MSSAAIATITKMMETLPTSLQGQAVEHIREYLADLQEELRWDSSFERTQPQLIAAARRAREEVAAGLAEPLDPEQL